MQLTLNLPDDLMRELQMAAAQQGTTVTQIVEGALVAWLRGSAKEWRSFAGGLAHEEAELKRIDEIIEREFAVVDED